MTRIKSILVSLAMAFSICNASAEIRDGMLFRSYDVPADQRTSMTVSGAQGKPLAFSDSLSISFSLRLELNKGKFGYVCRLAMDDLLPVDLFLLPESGEPKLCVTGDHRHIVPLSCLMESVEEWNDIYLSVADRGDSLYVSVNRIPVFATLSKASRHHAKAYFGKVDAPSLLTSDAAPMMIADLRVALDGGKSASWELSEASDLETRRGISVSASNYMFLRQTNSEWTRIWSSELSSPAYAAISRDKEEICFISNGQLFRNDVSSAHTELFPFSADMKLNLVSGEFLYAADGTLCYADMETGQFIRYDKAAHDWAQANGRTRKSVHVHHNTVYLDSLAIQMFGYGQHRYSNEVFVWNTAKGTMQKFILEGVSPRYLSAAGVKDGKIYVLGGRGNAAGLQGLGVQNYSDFIEIDPSDWSVKTLWSSPVLENMVPASDLVFDEGMDSFLTLVYNPLQNDSSLQLMRFNFSTGESEALADQIPYGFTDVTSNARLFYSDRFDVYFACLAYIDAQGQPKAEILMLGAPAMPARKAINPVSGHRLALLLLLFAAIAAAVLIVMRRRDKAAENADETVPAEHESLGPGIHLLGGFHVIDREGNDITSSFSPVLIQLLAILVIYSKERSGVSNALLKDLLWPDMSDESYNNNKGVNIRKLRTRLAGVGNVSIVIENGVWTFRDEDGLCDYPVAGSMLLSDRADDVIRAAMKGPLLPEYHFEWLDPFKAGYADLALSRLDQVCPEGSSNELVIKAADARIKFDSLDEDAILRKCKALVALGKVGTAQAVFKNFADGYASVMGEDFSKDFTGFLNI